MSKEKFLDEEFIKCTLLIQKNYAQLTKHQKVRVDKWLDKLVHITNGVEWKKNRNLYTKFMLNCILTNNWNSSPFNKQPDDGELPILNKTIQQKRIHEKVEQQIQEQNIQELIDLNKEINQAKLDEEAYEYGMTESQYQIEENTMRNNELNHNNNMSSRHKDSHSQMMTFGHPNSSANYLQAQQNQMGNNYQQVHNYQRQNNNNQIKNHHNNSVYSHNQGSSYGSFVENSKMTSPTVLNSGNFITYSTKATGNITPVNNSARTPGVVRDLKNFNNKTDFLGTFEYH